MIAAIYARSSTDKQGDTIEHQVQMIQEYAKRFNLDVKFAESHIYEDDGESGFKTTLLQRPSMRKLMENIDNGLVNVVFFKGISRFARDSGEAIMTAKRLSQKGIRVISIEENYDSSKDDPTMFQIYAVMAEQESRKTSVRVSLGNKQKARNGLWVTSSVPLGYSKIKDIKDDSLKESLISKGKHPHSLHPDPEYADMIKSIFELYVHQGYGKKRITAWLNQKGFKTRKGRYFSDKSIKDIISNEVYIGNVVYGKTRYDYIDTDGSNKKKVKTIEIDKSDWAFCENAHLPLIDLKLFMEAQSIMKGKEGKYNMSRRFNAARHPLTGILRCGRCNAPMVCQKRSNIKSDGTKKEYRYYTCSTAHRNGRHVCDQPNVNADELEGYIHDVITKELKLLKDNDKILEGINKYDPNDSINNDINNIDHNIANKVKNQTTLLDNIDLYDQETFVQINKKLKEEISLLRMQKQKLLDQLSFSIYLDNEEDLLKKVDEFIEMNLEDLSVSREIFHEWINQIILDGKSIKIDQKFNL